MIGSHHVFDSPGAALRAQRIEARRLVRAVYLSQLESANATLRVVSASAPVDRGEYKNSLEVWENRQKNEVRLEANAPHSGIIEMGARPFWPPLEPLIEWVKRKAGALGIVNVPAGGTFRGPASLNRDQNQQAEEVARAVQRAIAHRGLRAKYPMRNALPFALKMLDWAFTRRAQQIATDRLSRKVSK